jgi:2-hydroxychromene-2-carboxylate isomerase
LERARAHRGGGKARRQKAIAQRELTELLARALVAAEQQYKSWELHDLMLEADKDQLNPDGLAKMAGEAGLNVAQWMAALDSEATKARVAAHKQACNALGVDRETPAYFINGRLMLGPPPPVDDIVYVVKVELAGGFELLPKH